mgnify:CR=1 FL=1
MRTVSRSFVALLMISSVVAPSAYGQGRGGQNPVELRARRDSLDVFFAPQYTAPLFMNVPRVVAIFDVSFAARD